MAAGFEFPDFDPAGFEAPDFDPAGLVPAGVLGVPEDSLAGGELAFLFSARESLR